MIFLSLTYSRVPFTTVRPIKIKGRLHSTYKKKILRKKKLERDLKKKGNLKWVC